MSFKGTKVTFPQYCPGGEEYYGIILENTYDGGAVVIAGSSRFYGDPPQKPKWGCRHGKTVFRRNGNFVCWTGISVDPFVDNYPPHTRDFSRE